MRDAQEERERGGGAPTTAGPPPLRCFLRVMCSGDLKKTTRIGINLFLFHPIISFKKLL